MKDPASVGANQTIINTSVVTDQLLATFATNINTPGVTNLPAGVVSLHIHGTQTSGTKVTALYYKLYQRTAGGSETLLGTSGNTVTIAGIDTSLDTDITLALPTVFLVTDRLVAKVYATCPGGGSAPDITLTIEGVTASRMQLGIQQPISSQYTTFGTVIDGQGGVISIGQKGYIKIPYAGTITGWTIIGKPNGSCVFDVWKLAGGTLPTVANTITAAAKPTLTTAAIATSTTLTGWTTSVQVDDIVGFNLDSASTCTWAILEINITKS